MQQAIETVSVQSYYQSLQPFCEAGLAKSIDPSTHLYSRQLRAGRWQETLGTEDLTSTCIALIGIHRAGLAPSALRLQPSESLEAICRSCRMHGYAGGIGLVLWAHAVWEALPTQLAAQRSGVQLEKLDELVGGLTTMETAWLLSGLLHQWLQSRDDEDERLCEHTVRLLQARYVPAARLMQHATQRAGVADRLRRYTANFADQIYSIQALSFAAIARNDRSAQRTALAIADRIVDLQGSSGQWWWHYDVRSGNVAQTYPVYSVHQHGMAPMALWALERASGNDFSSAVQRGQQWIANNELEQSLVDEQAETIWRDIQRRESAAARWLRRVGSTCGRTEPPVAQRRQRLCINRETRPYEWAWCLYSGAIASGQASAAHIV